MTPSMRNQSIIGEGLTKDSQGVWHSNQPDQVSYPAAGHNACFEVEESSFWFQHRNRCLISLTRRFAPPDQGIILEVGGGNGVVAAALGKAGFDVALIEPGLEGARNAHARGIETVICATLEDANISPTSIPAVGLFDVIEHVPDDELFIGSIRTALIDGGLVYITVPALSFLWAAEDIEAGHYRRYSLKTIESLLHGAGFKIEYSSYLFWSLALPVFLFRALPFRLGIYKPQLSDTETAKTHGLSGGVMSSLLKRSLIPEEKRISKGKGLPFGSSLVVVARKVS